jgi:hypothetical protein
MLRIVALLTFGILCGAYADTALRVGDTPSVQSNSDRVLSGENGRRRRRFFDNRRRRRRTPYPTNYPTPYPTSYPTGCPPSGRCPAGKHCTIFMMPNACMVLYGQQMEKCSDCRSGFYKDNGGGDMDIENGCGSCKKCKDSSLALSLAFSFSPAFSLCFLTFTIRPQWKISRFLRQEKLHRLFGWCSPVYDDKCRENSMP